MQGCFGGSDIVRSQEEVELEPTSMVDSEATVQRSEII